MKTTSIGRALALAAVLGIGSAAAAPSTLQWVGCSISKLAFMKDLAAAYEKETGTRIELEGGGATKGIREVAAHKSDLGGSCRMPLVYRDDKGHYTVENAERSVKMIPVGWDALVVIVNKKQMPIESISRDDLRKVLTGEITNWKELGSPIDHKIKLYDTQSRFSGVGLTLRQQLFNNIDQTFAPSATLLPDSGDVEEAVEKDPYGIGVTGYSSARLREVRMLWLDGVEPNMQTLKDGRYMLYRILFLVAPGDFRKRADLSAFVDYTLSVKGQRIIEQAGTLPYRHGMHLLSSAATPEYLQTLEMVEQSGIYSPAGH